MACFSTKYDLFFFHIVLSELQLSSCQHARTVQTSLTGSSPQLFPYLFRLHLFVLQFIVSSISVGQLFVGLFLLLLPLPLRKLFGCFPFHL